MPKQAFLVRGANGQMATVIGHSIRGALKIYLQTHRPKPQRNDIIEIKIRGQGSWSTYKVH